MVLIHENHDKITKCYTNPAIWTNFDFANLSMVANIWLNKIK